MPAYATVQQRAEAAQRALSLAWKIHVRPDPKSGWTYALFSSCGHLRLTQPELTTFVIELFRHPHDYYKANLLLSASGANPKLAFGQLAMNFYQYAQELERLADVLESQSDSIS